MHVYEKFQNTSTQIITKIAPWQFILNNVLELKHSKHMPEYKRSIFVRNGSGWAEFVGN
jgi:hypothetical protein